MFALIPLLSLRAPLAASPVPFQSRQLILVVSSGWDAPYAWARPYERAASGAAWLPKDEAVPVSLGRSGLAWGRGLHPSGLAGPVKKEGDGRSPAGIFDLRSATGYSPAPPPRTLLPYRAATPTLRCVDDPTSRLYNQLVDEAAVSKDWASAEEMRRADDLYRLVVWVGQNDAPARPGGGSCVFLHNRASREATTAGCTAFDLAPLEALFAWLDPAMRPVLVQLPESAYGRLATSWALPHPMPAAP